MRAPAHAGYRHPVAPPGPRRKLVFVLATLNAFGAMGRQGDAVASAPCTFSVSGVCFAMFVLKQPSDFNGKRTLLSVLKCLWSDVCICLDVVAFSKRDRGLGVVQEIKMCNASS